MSQSIDFRINDLINEYLDYKGYSNTANAFSDERQTRQEPITTTIHANVREKEKDKYKKLKVFNHFKIIKFFSFDFCSFIRKIC
jgi:hypothetical protein